MAENLPEAFLGDRTIPWQALSHAFDPTGPALQQRWPCRAACDGLLIFTLSITALLASPIPFSNPYLKWQCSFFYIINLPLSLHSCTMTQATIETAFEKEVMFYFLSAGSILKGGRSLWEAQLNQTPSRNVWTSTPPFVVVTQACLSCFVCSGVCKRWRVPASATVSKYMCFSGSCQSTATLFCTPTVACGTIIFVNATLVTFLQSPERSGLNKHRHAWFRYFFPLYFQHMLVKPIRSILEHHTIRNETYLESGRVPSMNCASDAKPAQEKNRKK